MGRSRAVLAAVVVTLMASALPSGVVAQDESDTSGGGALVAETLVYATGRSSGAGGDLSLILFRPSTRSEDAPLVIDVGGTSVDPMSLVERGASVLALLFFPDRWSEFALEGEPGALRTMAEAIACAVRFARGSEYGSETAPLVLVGYSSRAAVPAHVALAGESFDRVWGEYESVGGPPAEWDCAINEATTRVDGYVGINGGYDAVLGSELTAERDPDLQEMLRRTVGLHPELEVRLIYGDADPRRPREASVAFETVLAEAGYDVEVVEFAGGHTAPHDLTAETVMEIAS